MTKRLHVALTQDYFELRSAWYFWGFPKYFHGGMTIKRYRVWAYTSARLWRLSRGLSILRHDIISTLLQGFRESAKELH